MADINKCFAIRVWPTKVPVVAADWVPITCPIPTTQIVIENRDTVNAQAVRSDVADSSTEKYLPASLELTLRASAPQCWNIGEVVCWVAAAAGSGPICVTFLR